VKVSRTIADLQGSADVGEGHVAEALSYRAAFDHEEALTRAG
jgi:predicted ATPase with chaperone activity